MNAKHLKLVKRSVMRPVAPAGRKANDAYRVREHLTEAEMAKLLKALKANRNGDRDWLIGLMIYRHGLRVSEACDLRWDDIDLGKRTIIVRRLKGSTDSSHYLERDELAGLKALQRDYARRAIKSAYVFVNERGQPFGRMGIGRMIERAGEAAKLPFPVHVHMLRHSTGYALAGKGMDTPDLPRPVNGFRRAADQGHAKAQSNLGELYLHGHGVQQNFSEAEKYWRLAANQGHVVAQHNLGLLYAHGLGVPQDHVETEKWRRLAADQIGIDAQLSADFKHDAQRLRV